jgi:hypothetical protein
MLKAGCFIAALKRCATKNQAPIEVSAAYHEDGERRRSADGIESPRKAAEQDWVRGWWQIAKKRTNILVGLSFKLGRPGGGDRRTAIAVSAHDCLEFVAVRAMVVHGLAQAAGMGRRSRDRQSHGGKDAHEHEHKQKSGGQAVHEVAHSRGMLTPTA